MKVTRHSLEFTPEEVSSVGASRLVDVRFDGHRVWSVKLPDAEGDHITVKWPEPIRTRLQGQTDLVIEDTTDGHLLVQDSVSFGRAKKRVEIVDYRGQWMAMTKWNRLGPVLEGSDDNVAARLLASARRLVDDLEVWGYPVYIVGGTLLGIIRNGGLLPHDDDIDLCFLSDESDPAELGRVSFTMERQLVDAGYTVVRHSLAQLEIAFFDESGQIDHYIDIFTGFFHDGLYCQPFALRGPEVVREDLVPTKPLSVNGVELPAPANPEAWLSYAYGPGWRVPDPTFKFIVPSATRFRFNSWFGVFNRGRYFWEKHYQERDERRLPPRGEADVADFLKRIPAGSNIIDLGCGDGALSAQMAKAGHRVVGVDFSHEALRVANKENREGVTFFRVNLNDRTAVFELAAQMVRTREVWHVFVRDTMHGLTYVNKENVMMFLGAALRPSALAYITFYRSRSKDYRRADPRTWGYGVRAFRRMAEENQLSVKSLQPGASIGRRRRAIAVLTKSTEPRGERTSWEGERDEDIQ
jgi:SAM-dependent methyltransferase